MNRLTRSPCAHTLASKAQRALPNSARRSCLLSLHQRNSRFVCTARPRQAEPDEKDLVSLPHSQIDDWPDKETDWYEYWNYERWDAELEDLDDRDDSDNVVENRMAAAERAQLFLNFMRTSESDYVTKSAPITLRTDDIPFPEVEEVERDVLYKDIDKNDLRAISEKRRFQALMDERVTREVSRPRIPELKWWRDVRLRKADGSYELPPQVWTEESFMNLITLNGKTVHPSKVPHHVKNPYVNADWSNEYGVKYVEETEELLERLGHWARPDTRDTLNHYMFVPPDVISQMALDDDQAGELLLEEGEEDTE